MRDDRLPGMDIERTPVVLDAERAPEDDGDFLELGTLPRLGPPFRRQHARHAHLCMTGVGAAGVLLDDLGLRADAGDDGWTVDDRRHVVENHSTLPARIL
jgi:hypothetical protein